MKRVWRLYGKAEELTGANSEKAFCEGCLLSSEVPQVVRNSFLRARTLGKALGWKSPANLSQFVTPSFSSQWQKLLISHDPLFLSKPICSSLRLLTHYSRMSPIGRNWAKHCARQVIRRCIITYNCLFWSSWQLWNWCTDPHLTDEV